MKILIFTEGTILMHKSAKEDYSSYISINNASQKIMSWKQQGAEILYLTSRKKQEQVESIKNVLKKYHFPKGELLFRKNNEEYSDIVERIIPDILIEDDCKSIGEDEIVIHHIKPEIRKRVKSIVVKEFEGIDELPDDIQDLLELKNAIKKNYIGVIIEESLENKDVLKTIKIISTRIETVTEIYKTPWIKQWTLYTVEIQENKIDFIAEKLSASLDSQHPWYADFKNASLHYIIFRNKRFKVNRQKPEQYAEVTKYGLTLGIPDYQLDFSPQIK
ncbi:hypothetical protein HZA96_01065 [Candidatus Woesearchaeota archaeon]|nr:hypothetical protein [Candidatus Woesearchaeota archaeon]